MYLGYYMCRDPPSFSHLPGCKTDDIRLAVIPPLTVEACTIHSSFNTAASERMWKLMPVQKKQGLFQQ